VNTFWVVINKKTWNSMPPDIQKAIEGVSGEWAIKNIFAANWDAGDKEAIRRMGIKPEQMFTLSDADVKKAKEISKQVWSEEISKLQGQGKPAQKIFDESLRFLQAYK
jgi:TRAP-type C4-dicarboxylate transport system substrate-binding protein